MYSLFRRKGNAVFDAGTKTAGPLYKREAVGTFRNSRIRFMCADGDAVQAAVVFCAHVVLALGNGTVNVVIFLHFHGENPHFYKNCSTGERE